MNNIYEETKERSRYCDEKKWKARKPLGRNRRLWEICAAVNCVKWAKESIKNKKTTLCHCHFLENVIRCKKNTRSDMLFCFTNKLCHVFLSSLITTIWQWTALIKCEAGNFYQQAVALAVVKSDSDIIKYNESCQLFLRGHAARPQSLAILPFHNETYPICHIHTSGCDGGLRCAYHYCLLLTMPSHMHAIHWGHLSRPLGVIAGGHTARMTAWKHVNQGANY